jgi:hypothetical protein
MYKYRVNFRYRTAQNTTSGFTQGVLEFSLGRRIDMDGAGEWRNIVKNVIQAQYGISSTSILNEALELKQR